ncbi:MAG TPA: hypothetical protein VFR34_01510 [Paracoccaceae bacterium]|nr:hypothetical protein [Paracoccaceae bacterium]
MLPAFVPPQLDALPLMPGRPLLAVDADEVLVVFAEHFDRFLRARGFRLNLTEYRLDGAILELDGARAGLEQSWTLIEDFFAAETRHQAAIAGAAAGLATLVSQVQIIVLTNVPRFAREDRIANLAGLGMDYPLVASEGGKGRVLAELARRVRAPVAFIDDSPVQIQSAARHAAAILRIHFVGSPMVRAVAPQVPEAHHAPPDWPAIVEILSRHFG